MNVKLTSLINSYLSIVNTCTGINVEPVVPVFKINSLDYAVRSNFNKQDVQCCSVPFKEVKQEIDINYIDYTPIVKNRETASIRKRLVISFSGGLDSLLALYHALYNTDYNDIVLVHMNYNSPYSKKELEAVFDIVRSLQSAELTSKVDIRLKIINVRLSPLTGSLMKSGYIIPGRNALFSSLASEVGSTIWVISHIRSSFGMKFGAQDKTPDFFEEISFILSSIHGKKIEVLSPFSALSKTEVLVWAKAFLPIRLLLIIKKSISCYSSLEGSCGECISCLKRYKAIENSKLSSFNSSFFKKDPSVCSRLYEVEQLEKLKGRSW